MLACALLACDRRVEARHGVIGGREADGFFYVVPATDGVVLVDTGEDEGGRLLRSLVAGRRVLAIVVTHAHHDHYAAASQFDAPVFVGADDIPRMEGKTQHQGAIQTQWRAQNGGKDRLPPLPRDLRPVVDGQVLTFGELTFEAIALPGHTPGSTAFRFKELLFGGDAAMAIEGRIEPIADGYSDDPNAARRAVERLRRVPFEVVLDGHHGVTELGPAAIP